MKKMKIQLDIENPSDNTNAQYGKITLSDYTYNSNQYIKIEITGAKTIYINKNEFQNAITALCS